MYNIAITKENKTEFFNCTGDKPRQYPTLADALVSAQYLGLSRGDVELHFVKDGASIERFTQEASPVKKTGKSIGKPDGEPCTNGKGGKGKTGTIQAVNDPQQNNEGASGSDSAGAGGGGDGAGGGNGPQG